MILRFPRISIDFCSYQPVNLFILIRRNIFNSIDCIVGENIPMSYSAVHVLHPTIRSTTFFLYGRTMSVHKDHSKHGMTIFVAPITIAKLLSSEKKHNRNDLLHLLHLLHLLKLFKLMNLLKLPSLLQ